jgi:hypothetical protein
MAFYDAFFGSDQSLYIAYAIMAAIITICITILLTATDISIGNRILIVLFVIITLIPSIFLTLFQITCMVTGGTEPNRWWCYAYTWILAAFIIIYCVFVVIISLISLFTYNNAIDNVNKEERKNKLIETNSNNISKQIINTEGFRVLWNLEQKNTANTANTSPANPYIRPNPEPVIEQKYLYPNQPSAPAPALTLKPTPTSAALSPYRQQASPSSYQTNVPLTLSYYQRYNPPAAARSYGTTYGINAARGY